LAIALNHIELFSMIFLEQLLYSKFPQINFESPIQNWFGIAKCAVNQSCRELNFEQLLFWGQILKMPFFFKI
jgi:hypothetical protein